jgi:membrane-associated protein
MWEFLHSLGDPKRLQDLANQYENWWYLFMFLIVFCETGLVVMPLLPGDTFLFASGVLAGSPCKGGTDNVLEIGLVMPLLCAAAILGDSLNYWIGRWVGPKVFHKDHAKFLDKENLHRAHRFYEKNGGKAVFIARFLHLIRCFAPFVAGVGTMPYKRFLFFSVMGTLSWIGAFVLGGYFLGGFPIVQKYFIPVSLIVIGICMAGILMTIVRQFRKGRAARKAAAEEP